MGALDDKPFGVVPGDTAMGDQGVALAQSKKFTGDSDQDKEFENLRPNRNVSATQMQDSGHG